MNESEKNGKHLVVLHGGVELDELNIRLRSGGEQKQEPKGAKQIEGETKLHCTFTGGSSFMLPPSTSITQSTSIQQHLLCDGGALLPAAFTITSTVKYNNQSGNHARRERTLRGCPPGSQCSFAVQEEE